jgi:Icc protein
VTPKRRILWLTDIHLEFLKKPQIEDFFQHLKTHQPDAVCITGDISIAPNVAAVVRLMALTLACPVYFVLGNHDFYKGDISTVRDEMASITHARTGAVWLPAAGVVELTAGVGLVGHDGWADGRYGDYLRSPILLNDYVQIADLQIRDTAERFEKVKQLGKQAGDYLRGILPEAARRYRHVMVMIHTPPFREACWYEGKIPNWDNPYLPHFACKAAGDALLHIAEMYPHVEFTVLCGHVHHSGIAEIRPNLTVYTGDAEYNAPKIQATLEM